MSMANIVLKYVVETMPKPTHEQRREMQSKLRLDENPAECLNLVLDEFRYMENCYEMRTIEFYARFVQGKLDDSEDFINWAGDFQSYQKILKDHFEIPGEAASTKTKRQRATKRQDRGDS